jgi:glycosyltransferase involved in cell wall biosynthesis
VEGEGYVLFTGRIKLYQGLELLLESWKIASPLLPKLKLIIAGEFKGDLPHLDGLMIINSWLSRESQEDLISRCTVLALPYLESSQSGIFMQGVEFGVPIVATPVGGLIEQSANYPGSILSSSTNSQDFADALVRAVTLPRGEQFLKSYLDIQEVLITKYFPRHPSNT